MPELSLGILRAGGAYVPLDPAYPKERLAFILRDTRVCMLLTQQSLSENLPEVPEVEVFRYCYRGGSNPYLFNLYSDAGCWKQWRLFRS